MLKIAVCDDDLFYLDKIKDCIKNSLERENFDSYQVDVYSSGVELWNSEKINTYNVIFLDVNMPAMSGLELAEKIRESNQEIMLVFISEFIDYAVQGYKMDVLRFLLKDMLNEMLPECMEAIVRKLSIHNHMVEYHFNEGKKVIPIDTINYIESQKHKLHYFFIKDVPVIYSLYNKLDNIEKEFLPYNFLRIHKSFLVNTAFVLEIVGYKVKLKDGKLLPVPREKYQKVRERYYEIKGDLL